MTCTRRTLTALLLASSLFACGEDTPIQIGAVLPLTGEWDIYGREIRNGIELASQDINADPEYPFTLALRVEDTQSDPGRAKTLLAQVYDGGANAAIGGVTTDEALEMVSVAEERGRVLVSPSASNPRLTGISRYFYRVCASDAKEGNKMGHYAAQTVGIKTIVILAADTPYARGIQDIFRETFVHNGGEVLEVIEFPRGTTMDVTGLVERVITLKPQAVYLADWADTLVRLIKGLRSRGFQGRILTTSAFATPEALEQTGPTAEGILLTQIAFEVEGQDERVRRFVEGYRRKYNEDPSLFAAQGYDSFLVLAEALKEAGRLAGDLWPRVRGLRDFEGVTGTIQFDERGDVQKFPRVYWVKDGVLSDYEEFRRAEIERLRRELEEIRTRQRRLRREGE